MQKQIVYVGWSKAAGSVLEEGGIDALKKWIKDGKGDAEVIEFNTPAEAKAFMLGVDKGSGWDCPALSYQSAKVKPPRIVVEIKGGAMQFLYGSPELKGADVCLLDYDNINAGDEITIDQKKAETEIETHQVIVLL